MPEQRTEYKGHEIVVRTPGSGAIQIERGPRPPVTPAGRVGREALLIDGKSVFTVQVNGGSYIASGFAYSPAPSLEELARRMIDYREAVSREHGDEPS